MSIDTDVAVIARNETGDVAQQRRFARTRGTDEGNHLAVCNREINAIKRSANATMTMKGAR